MRSIFCIFLCFSPGLKASVTSLRRNRSRDQITDSTISNKRRTFPLRKDESANGDVGEHDDDVDDDGDGNGVGGHKVLVADVLVDEPPPQPLLQLPGRDLHVDAPGPEPAAAHAAEDEDKGNGALWAGGGEGT